MSNTVLCERDVMNEGTCAEEGLTDAGGMDKCVGDTMLGIRG
jgi:hypothetical protein